MKTKKIAIIGGGNLGMSLALGLVRQGIPKENLVITKKTPMDSTPKGFMFSLDNRAAVDFAEIVILAVKPFKVHEVLDYIAPSLNADKHILVSVATGIAIENMQAKLPDSLPVFRAMPNIAASVGEAMTCIAHQNANDAQVQLVSGIFDAIGSTIAIEEELMAAATVLGACGTAYVMRFIRAMIQGGIQIGFGADVAGKIVNQTVAGAVEILRQNNSHPEQEIDKVTTPQGCTIAGLNEMEHHGFSSALICGIVASREAIED